MSAGETPLRNQLDVRVSEVRRRVALLRGPARKEAGTHHPGVLREGLEVGDDDRLASAHSTVASDTKASTKPIHSSTVDHAWPFVPLFADESIL